MEIAVRLHKYKNTVLNNSIAFLALIPMKWKYWYFSYKFQML